MNRKQRYSPSSVLILLALVLIGAASFAEDPKREAAKALPRGAGIGAKFLADKGIEKHASVRFAENFERDGYRKRFDEVRDRDGKVLSLKSGGDVKVVGERSLLVTGDSKKNTGGGATKWFKSSERIFVRFYAKFDEECDYVHHFVTLRANKSLKGGDRWSGFGGAGLKPAGDERFSTALEPWGNWGRWPAPGRWNFYSYWHEMKASGDGKYWGNSFKPDSSSDKKKPENIIKGRWICLEFMLAHNTPGKKDGEQAFWVDGELKGHWTGINWRKTPGLMANALTLEAYLTDRWTKKRVNKVWFDNLVIATEYIGPTGQAK